MSSFVVIRLLLPTISMISVSALAEYDYAPPDSALCDYDSSFKKLNDMIDNFLKLNPRNRPPRTPNGSIPLTTVSLWVASLDNVHENRNHYAITGGLDIEQEPMLSWNPLKFCNLTRVEIEDKQRVTRFWNPRQRSSFIKQRRQLQATTVYVRNRILAVNTWGFSETMVKCSFDPLFYPFDTQLCSWKLVFKIPQQYEMRIKAAVCYKYTYEDLHPIWELKTCSGEAEREGNYLTIWFQVLLSRKYEYALVTVVLPTLILANANAIIFIIPSEYPESASIGMAFLLAFFLYLAQIKVELPQSTTHPYFMYYLISVLVLNCVAIVTSTCLLRLRIITKQRYYNKVFLLSMICIEVLFSIIIVSVLMMGPTPICTADGRSCVYRGTNITMMDP